MRVSHLVVFAVIGTTVMLGSAVRSEAATSPDQRLDQGSDLRAEGGRAARIRQTKARIESAIGRAFTSEEDAVFGAGMRGELGFDVYAPRVQVASMGPEVVTPLPTVSHFLCFGGEASILFLVSSGASVCVNVLNGRGLVIHSSLAFGNFGFGGRQRSFGGLGQTRVVSMGGAHWLTSRRFGDNPIRGVYRGIQVSGASGRAGGFAGIWIREGAGYEPFEWARRTLEGPSLAWDFAQYWADLANSSADHIGSIGYRAGIGVQVHFASIEVDEFEMW